MGVWGFELGVKIVFVYLKWGTRLTHTYSTCNYVVYPLLPSGIRYVGLWSICMCRGPLDDIMACLGSGMTPQTLHKYMT